MTVDAFLDLPVRDGLSDLTSDDDFELDLRVSGTHNEPAIVDGPYTVQATCNTCADENTCPGWYSCNGTCTVPGYGC